MIFSGTDRAKVFQKLGLGILLNRILGLYTVAQGLWGYYRVCYPNEGESIRKEDKRWNGNWLYTLNPKRLTLNLFTGFPAIWEP